MAKEFNLLGQSITITEEQDRYYQLCYFYRNLAASAGENFRNFYNHSTDSLDSFLDKAPLYVLQLYADACTNMLQALVKYDLFEYNQDYLVDNYIIPYSQFKKAYDELDEFNASLIADKDAQNAYRTARRQSRGRWVGGGFGIEGAIKGAATAGAMNLATGAVHGVFNLAGSAFTSLSISSKKNKVYSNPETCTKLAQAIYFDIFNLRLAYIDIVSEHTDIKYAVISPENVSKSNILLKNVQQLNIPSDKKPTLLVEALQLNPFSADMYLHLFKNYPSEIDSIYEYVKYIKAENALFLLKKELSAFYATLPTDNEQNALESKKKLEERMQLWHFSSAKELNDINAKLIAFDIAARTFQGVEYKTREECEKVKNDLAVLQEELKSLSKVTPQNLSQWNAFKDLVSSENYSDQIKEVLLPDIKEAYDIRLKEIKDSLTRSFTDDELSNLIAEVNNMHIDSEMKEETLRSVNYNLKRNAQKRQEAKELALFKPQFYKCDPCSLESKHFLKEFVEANCPQTAHGLNMLIDAFTPSNIELIKGFSGPNHKKRLTFHGSQLLGAIIALFLSLFIFSGLLGIICFLVFVYCICHVFAMEYHVSKNDWKLNDLKRTMTYNEKLIHPMLRNSTPNNSNNSN